jgi:FMN phosphatase YigB (HAD superfamily)
MIIFVDMDGVLSDFDKYIIETHDFGDKKTWNDQWSKLPDRMFFELDKMPDADQLMEYVSSYDPQFLTAIPKHKDKQKSTQAKFSRIDKYRWMKKHWNVKPWYINCVYREEKQMFAVDDNLSPNILIDDSKDNIAEWKKAGGAGIFHTSAQNSIIELQKLGY